MKKHATPDRGQAEALAVAGLSFLAGEPERLGRFLALSGLGPHQLRTAAAEPEFLAGVLEHIAADEQLLLAFAVHASLEPKEIERARLLLAGPAYEHNVP